MRNAVISVGLLFGLLVWLCSDSMAHSVNITKIERLPDDPTPGVPLDRVTAELRLHEVKITYEILPMMEVLEGGTLEIYDKDGNLTAKKPCSYNMGANEVRWQLRITEPESRKGQFADPAKSPYDITIIITASDGHTASDTEADKVSLQASQWRVEVDWMRPAAGEQANCHRPDTSAMAGAFAPTYRNIQVTEDQKDTVTHTNYLASLPVDIRISLYWSNAQAGFQEYILGGHCHDPAHDGTQGRGVAYGATFEVPGEGVPGQHCRRYSVIYTTAINNWVAWHPGEQAAIWQQATCIHEMCHQQSMGGLQQPGPIDHCSRADSACIFNSGVPPYTTVQNRWICRGDAEENKDGNGTLYCLTKLR